MFAVRPICVQDSIFKMSSESPGDLITSLEFELKQREFLQEFSDELTNSW